MNCTGIDVSTGSQVVVSFERNLQSVDPPVSDVENPLHLAPGWIDLQVNGFAGADYNSPRTPPEEIARSIRVLFSTGVTRLFPTVITGPPDNMIGTLRNLVAAKDKFPEGRAMEGFHVEGPHISPDDGPRGAHPRDFVRPPDIEEFKRWQEAARGNVRLVTLSPEWPEAVSYIEALVREGVVVAVGHTNAGAAQIQDAAKAGATMCTHLGNGTALVLERHPNTIWEQLAEDRLAAGFIVDGIHLPPSFLKVALRAKGLERFVLVSDAVMPAGCRPGRFKIGDIEIELHPDNRVTLAGKERFAGSALRMDRGIENLMKLAGLSLRDAVSTATRNPARVARIASRQRGLAPGDRADLVEFRFDPDTKSIAVERTFLDGEQVFP